MLSRLPRPVEPHSRDVGHPLEMCDPTFSMTRAKRPKDGFVSHCSPLRSRFALRQGSMDATNCPLHRRSPNPKAILSPGPPMGRRSTIGRSTIGRRCGADARVPSIVFDSVGGRRLASVASPPPRWPDTYEVVQPGLRCLRHDDLHGDECPGARARRHQSRSGVPRRGWAARHARGGGRGRHRRSEPVSPDAGAAGAAASGSRPRPALLRTFARLGE